MKRKNILLVGRDVHIGFSIWKTLRGDGFTVFAADSAESALQVSRNHSGAIALLLADLEMCGSNPLDLCNTLKAERPTIKIVLMSDDEKAKQQCERAGFIFLKRPFPPSALRAAIQAALGSK